MLEFDTHLSFDLELEQSFSLEFKNCFSKKGWD